MSKKLSRREAIVSLGATTAAAGLVAVSSKTEASDSVLGKDQKARMIIVKPLSGNNPIVVAPPQAIAVNGSSLHVDIENFGPSGGNFRIKLARFDANLQFVYKPLDGFSSAPISDDIISLDAGKVWSKNYNFSSSSSFSTYSLLILVYEIFDKNGDGIFETENYRIHSTTQIRWGVPK